MAGLLDGLLADDTTKDDLGLTQADRRQPMWSGLIKAGLLGVAAGGNLMPAQRAGLIAQAGGALGDIPSEMMQYRSQAAQQALAGQRVKGQRAELEQAEKWRQYADSAEFRKALDDAQASEADRMAAKAAALKGDFGTVQKILDPSRYQPKVDFNTGVISYKNGDIDLINPLTFKPEPYRRNGQIVTTGPQQGQPTPQQPGQPVPPPIPAPGTSVTVPATPPPGDLGPGGGGGVGSPTPPVPAPTQVRFDPDGNPVGGQAPVPPPPKFTGYDDEFLKTLNPEVAREVKAIAEYDRKPYTIGQHGGMYNRRNRMVMDMVNQYSRGQYSESDFSVRRDVKKEFSQAGVTGKNMTALDTLYGHIGDLHEAAQALQTGNVTKLNEWSQAVRNQTGDPRVIDFNTARTAVADEMARAMKGAQISDTEIAHWKELFNAADAPEKVQAVITRAFHLLDEREKAIKSKFKIDMKQDYGDFISPANKAKRDFIKANPLVSKGANPEAGPPTGGGNAAPTPQEALEELKRRKQQGGK